MRVQHNIMSMNAYRNYNNNTSALGKNLEKLSSGYKINRAGDDAAGLAISEKMRAQITGLDAAQSNAKDGVSLVQTAEGALTEVHDMLNRMYELADKAANGTFDAFERNEMQKEIEELKNEIDRISETANFNGIKLLNGTLGAKVGGTEIKNGVKSVSLSNIGEFATSTQVTFEAKTDDSGNVTLEIKAGGKNITVSGFTVTASGDSKVPEGGKGGSVAFDIKYTEDASKATGVLVDVIKMLDGAKVSVNVDFANSKTGKYATGTFTGAATAAGLDLQIGDDAQLGNRLKVDLESTSTKKLGVSAVAIRTQDDAREALTTIKNAINKVSSTRGTLGATQNRLEHTLNSLSVTKENVQNAESGIRDTDVADEMMAYTKNNILIQSAQAMLAQANQVPQGVLQLLQ